LLQLMVVQCKSEILVHLTFEAPLNTGRAGAAATVVGELEPGVFGFFEDVLVLGAIYGYTAAPKGYLVGFRHVSPIGRCAFWIVLARRRGDLSKTGNSIPSPLLSSYHLEIGYPHVLVLQVVAVEGVLATVAVEADEQAHNPAPRHVHGVFLAGVFEQRLQVVAGEDVRQIDYLIERVGIDRVGFGSDFDGVLISQGIGDVSGLPRLMSALRDRGYDEVALRKLAHENWVRVLRKTWGE
jgi:Membrane dipeptidase (Peptidase family M19)